MRSVVTQCRIRLVVVLPVLVVSLPLTAILPSRAAPPNTVVSQVYASGRDDNSSFAYHVSELFNPTAEFRGR